MVLIINFLSLDSEKIKERGILPIIKLSESLNKTKYLPFIESMAELSKNCIWTFFRFLYSKVDRQFI